MYLTADPTPDAPSAIRMMPAIMVHRNRPLTPYSADDARDDYDERAGRASDGGQRSAQCRGEKPRNNGAVDAGLRRHAGRDGKCHRQRQGHQADGDARDGVRDERLLVVVAEGR